MKTGKTLTELAQEIERRAAAKQDYIAPSKALKAVVSDGAGVRLQVDDRALPMTNHAHGQMASYLEVPRRYYDRMLTDAPDLLQHTINRWLSDHGGERRMIRTLDDRVRAILSDRFRPLENEDMAQAVLPVLANLNVDVISADITETRFYLKAVDKSIRKDIPKGRAMGDGTHTIFDTISPAITVSNSEIGSGSWSVETSIWTRACTNLATFGAKMKRYHTGARAELSDEVYALLTDRTKHATDQAIFLQTRDLVAAAFEQAQFEALAMRLQKAGEDIVPEETKVTEVIERTRRKFTLSEKEGDSILQHLIKGGDLSRYGLHAAVTRTAEDLEDYDRASEFEKLGGQIIDLNPKEWRELAAAA